jgi:nitrogen fixation/metabolism regulation signal transduction histidine kinase
MNQRLRLGQGANWQSAIGNRQSAIFVMRYRNRTQVALALLTALFVLAILLLALLYGLGPTAQPARSPLLLTAFVAILIFSLVCVVLLLRQLLRPYRQLVGEAKRVPIQSNLRKARDEGEFVLETFQSVVAQLQKQREELEHLTALASERALSAEKFSERIVASMPSGLIAFDGSGLSIVINAPGRALLEFDGEARGQSVAALLGNIPRLAQMVEKCLQTGELYQREEIHSVTANGLPRRLGGTIAPIDLSPEQGARGALCLLTDITEVTHLREQVALKRNLESLGEMSAGLAHEFKNAIATLHGYVQLLQNLELDERASTVASSLLNEVRNLSEMVTAFLNFARPRPLELDHVSLSELLQECVTEVKPIYEEQRVELILEAGSAGPAQVRADERLLRQAILNLLRNGAQAIADGSEERKVMVRGSSQPGPKGTQFAVIEIEDTGEGISVSDLQRIFIPFFTTKAKGHGIGLALAHRVITEHGGSLTASNAKAGGAVFTIRLPV